MSRISNKEERFSDDLEEVADVLRGQRPTLDPVALDRVKLRAMSAARRSRSSRDKGFFMRSRLTTLLVAASLTLGTGGAIALACGGVGGAFGGGSAGFHQYKECDHGKDCGKGDKGKGGDKGGQGGGGDKGKGGQGGGGDKGGQGGGDKGKGGQGGGGDKGGQGGGDKGKGGQGGGGDKGKGGDKGHGHH